MCKSHKNKKILYLSVIIISLIFNVFLLNHPINQNSYTNDQNNNNNKNKNFYDDNLKTQTISSDNIFSGIGAPWNVTHWANRTDIGLTTSFDNGSYGIVEIPLESGWEGYELDANIKDLYDSRNWNNGSFAFGASDAIDPTHNDSARLPHISNNQYQNWTFHSNDTGSSINQMS